MFTLDEVFTIWVVTRNGFGETSTQRYEIAGKHAFRQELFTDKNGNQALSQAVFYYESNLPTLSTFVKFSVDTSSEVPGDANEIKAFAVTPSFGTLKKAWL